MVNLLHKLFCFSFAIKKGGEIRVINNSGKNNTFWINNMKLWNIEKYHSVMDLRWHLSENQWTKLADCDHIAFSEKTHSTKNIRDDLVREISRKEHGLAAPRPHPPLSGHLCKF